MIVTILTIAGLTSAILLIAVILLQQKGAGVSGLFGGSSNIYSTKRGVDKILHYSTIALAGIFFLISILQLLFR